MTHFGDIIRINDNAPYFNGQIAVVAYTYENYIEVYIANDTSNKIYSFKNNEFDRISNYDIRTEL